MNKQRYNWFDKNAKMRAFYKQLLEQNQVAQITVTNCSDQQREVTLWGANKCAPIANPLYGSDFVLRQAAVGQIPCEVVYNPVNDLFYVINNGTDTITIVNDQAEVIRTARLRNIPNIPINPNGIVVNTNVNSPEYGYVAIISETSTELIIVGLDFLVKRRIDLNTVPKDIIYNPIGDQYYITSFVSGAVYRISTGNDFIEYYLAINGVQNLGVNSDTGDLYFSQTATNTIEVYDTNRVRIGGFGLGIASDVSFFYHSLNSKLYVSFEKENKLLVINTQTNMSVASLNVGNLPMTIGYNKNDTYIYVANEIDQTFTRINENFEIVDTIGIASFNKSFAVSSKNGYFALNDAPNEKLIIYSGQRKPLVKITEDYQEIREDFKYNPILITHMKVVASTKDRIHTLQLIESSISGMETCESISLGSYQSPQGFGNVSEVFEMEGNIIDGRVCWRFKINPNQQVTFLIYYKQLEMYSFLPEKSRVSIGVQMSKGIPKGWGKED